MKAVGEKPLNASQLISACGGIPGYIRIRGVIDRRIVEIRSHRGAGNRGRSHGVGTKIGERRDAGASRKATRQRSNSVGSRGQQAGTEERARRIDLVIKSAEDEHLLFQR